MKQKKTQPSRVGMIETIVLVSKNFCVIDPPLTGWDD